MPPFVPDRGEQHPFTPEPREPEPWPSPFTPLQEPWFYGLEGVVEAAGDVGHLVLSPAEQKAEQEFRRDRRRAHRKRGFGFGFS